MIFLPRTHVPLVRAGQGINWYTEEYFTLQKNKEVILNIPHLNIHNKSSSLKELLLSAIKFEPSNLLSSYSNAFINVPVKLESGILTPIKIDEIKKQLNINEKYIPFAIDLPTAIIGNTLNNEHIFPNLFIFKKDLILIGSSSHANHPKNKKFDTTLTIYFYNNKNKLWQEILYKSLYEYSNKNYNIALVLLFSSLDIYTSSFFPNRNTRPPQIRIRLKKLGFKNRFIKNFSKKIADLRNDFEHEHIVPTQRQLIQAYEYAFHIYWEEIRKPNSNNPILVIIKNILDKIGN